jgi:hypothetical protein
MTLRAYILALVATLARHDSAGAARLREVVGRRLARITLDGESVDVTYVRRKLVVIKAGQSTRTPDGFGSTDRATAAALLDGRLEVYEAILDSRLELQGDLDAVSRIGIAIEILLDAATRMPELRALASRFRGESGPGGATSIPLPSIHEEEIALLEKLGLLRDNDKLMRFQRHS